MPLRKRHVGERFGKLVLVEHLGGCLWKTVCDCGFVQERDCRPIRERSRLGGVSSCDACVRKLRAQNGRRNATHGLSKTTPLYHVHRQILKRCTDPKHPDYPDYGGRGIDVAAEWRDVAAFYEWSMANGYEAGLTIDRRDNNRGYSPENCRWTTAFVQVHNRRPRSEWRKRAA